MNSQRPQPTKAQVTPAAELQALGRLLDSMESGAAPMSARQFRRAALRAGEILQTEEPMSLRRVCATSSALRELLQNELMQRAAADGNMRWMHSGKF